MKELSGGQAAVASLQAENVEQVFGLIGSATMEMFDALYDANDVNFTNLTRIFSKLTSHFAAFRKCRDRSHRSIK